MLLAVPCQLLLLLLQKLDGLAAAHTAWNR
jgi:hypothetical protein